MSTVCKIAVTAPAERVAMILEEYLRKRSLEFDVTETEWPTASKREFFAPSEDFPSILSVKQVTPEVTEIHYNSFSKAHDLASALSLATGANVVVNVYQSVSTASYWAFHANGQLVRAVEAGDGDVHSQSGHRLPFEHEAPGRPLGDEGEQLMNFDYEEQDWYNREVGVPVEVYQQYESSWTNFLLAIRPFEPVSARRGKLWWRFW
jgi:hypothetical protein